MLNNKSVLESPVFIWGNIGFDFIRKKCYKLQQMGLGCKMDNPSCMLELGTSADGTEFCFDYEVNYRSAKRHLWAHTHP